MTGTNLNFLQILIWAVAQLVEESLLVYTHSQSLSSCLPSVVSDVGSILVGPVKLDTRVGLAILELSVIIPLSGVIEILLGLLPIIPEQF